MIAARRHEALDPGPQRERLPFWRDQENNGTMIKNLHLAALLGGALLFGGCRTDGPGDPGTMDRKVDDALSDLQKEKEDATRELRKVREDIAVELAKAAEHLKDPSLAPVERTRWEEVRKEAKEQMERLDRSLKDVDSATAEAWSDVKRAATDAVRSTRDRFKRQAEKIDRKTDADADDDGH